MGGRLEAAKIRAGGDRHTGLLEQGLRQLLGIQTKPVTTSIEVKRAFWRDRNIETEHAQGGQ